MSLYLSVSSHLNTSDRWHYGEFPVGGTTLHKRSDSRCDSRADCMKYMYHARITAYLIILFRSPKAPAEHVKVSLVLRCCTLRHVYASVLRALTDWESVQRFVRSY
jgi:hypothetical protein